MSVSIEDMQAAVGKVDDLRAEGKLQGTKVTLEESCDKAGISTATYYNYKRKLGDEVQDTDTPEKDQIHMFDLTAEDKNHLKEKKTRKRRAKNVPTTPVETKKVKNDTNEENDALKALVAAQTKYISIQLAKNK
jgi:hypothetical protein